MRRWRAVAAALALVVACAGCGEGVSLGNGPLAMGGDYGEECMPFGSVHEFAYGFDVMRNDGPRPVSIESVTLFHPSHIRLDGAFLVPIENTTVIGNTQGWPPNSPEATAVWKRRVDAVGARLGRDRGYVNLVLHVVATSATDAGFDAVHVQYRVGNRRFMATTTTRFRVRPRCS
jgi:hypothetical protein